MAKMQKMKLERYVKHVNLPKRGRGARGTVEVDVVGEVSQDGDRIRIRTDQLADTPMGDLVAICQTLNVNPAIALAEGINAIKIRESMNTQPPRASSAEIQRMLMDNKLVVSENEAKQQAREIKRTSTALHVSPEQLVAALREWKKAS